MFWCSSMSLAFPFREDEAIAEADTLLPTVPNQLGLDYKVHVLESILTMVAQAHLLLAIDESSSIRHSQPPPSAPYKSTSDCASPSRELTRFNWAAKRFESVVSTSI